MTASEAYIRAARNHDVEMERNVIMGLIQQAVDAEEFMATFQRAHFLPTDFDFLHDLKYTVTSDAACIYVSWVDPKA